MTNPSSALAAAVLLIEYIGRRCSSPLWSRTCAASESVEWAQSGHFAKMPEAATYDDRMSRLDNALTRTSPPAMTTARHIQCSDVAAVRIVPGDQGLASGVKATQ